MFQQMDEKHSKYNERENRIIAAQFYLLKGLQNHPSKMIKHVVCNRGYYPYMTDDMIKQLMKEHNVTQKDIDEQQYVQFIYESEELKP